MQGAVVAVSFVTAGELHRWAHVRDWGASRRQMLADWLASVLVLESTPETWRIWGQITAEARLRGRPRPVADSWIAACCLAWDLPVVTSNQRDFGDAEFWSWLVHDRSLDPARNDPTR